MSERMATLYKYMRIEYVADAIEKHRLFLNDGSGFNDPFELLIVDRSNITYNRIHGLHILSLTNSYKKKLMWSHYADGHKGVCLTIRIPARLVYPIVYSSRRLYTDSNINQIINAASNKAKSNVNKDYSRLTDLKKMALLKDAKWKDEKEYRIIFDEYDEKGLIYDNDKWFMSVKIANIYLGVRFNENKPQDVCRIIDACHREGVSIKNMVLSNDDYSIRVNRNKI